eukprot:TRINITY_DN482_c0_g2_i1.p2 TRINITY_DN482_c0_g2~~TRINITY_DN482_c0_g2_i1.p2  ORF type:complete len:436 (-),score=108.95 TRINITY_DN482_c0_g2_i1:73-1380(-)
MLRKSLVLCCLALGAVVADVPADKVTSLPRLAGQLGNQYSGYIDAGAPGHHFHYSLVLSENNPKTDPLILWLNGGPGCSSLDGYFYEQGPLHFSDDYADKLVDNPSRWSKVASVLFLETPVGVGFSYADDKNYATNDNKTADENYQFVKRFFAAYPELAQNDFWISGESYAGIYVPMLSYRVANDPTINFKGFLVGNGVTDWALEGTIDGHYGFLYGHGVISTKQWNAIVTACNQDPNSHGCQAAQDDADNRFNGYDIYNIYGDCASQRPPPNFTLNGKPSSKAKELPPCTDAYAARDYLNLPEVKSALHVNASLTWDICQPLPYDRNTQSVIPIYQALIAQKKTIVVYSGDTDGCVPYTGTEHWINSLNLPLAKGTDWQVWTYDMPDGQQVGGHVTYYQGLTFVTVRGAGHMVPQYAPEAALHMVQKTITGNPL